MKGERRKFGMVFAFAFLFATLAFVSVGCASGATHYVPDDYAKIQWAVDDASAGDTIIVMDGTYTENVDVNKRLTIRSENGSASTIVQAADSGDHVFKVTADYVNISGFTVKGKGEYGIYLSGAEYCNISNNTVSNNSYGIYLSGAEYCNISNNTVSNNSGGIALLHDSNYNTITDNRATINLGWGIGLFTSSNNTIKNNIVSNNERSGIYLDGSSNNTLTNNTMSNNRYNLDIVGSQLSEFTQSIDITNKVNGKTVCYWVNRQDQEVPSDAGYVGIVNCKNILVKNLTLTNNGQGILLVYSNDSIIENTSISNNDHGIYLVGSSNNNIKHNIVSNNDNVGIVLEYSSNGNNIENNNVMSNDDGGLVLDDSSNNILYFNNFVDNTNNVIYFDSNIWNSTEKITYTYQGSTYTNYLGNHWGDYTGSDTDGDGIGDEPYSFPPQGRIDNYPLIEPFDNYLPTPPPENQPPTCAIKLQKTGVPIANINVGEFFDIYVGGSTDDQCITEVRFSSDDAQDGNPTGEWTDWYDWDTSSGDWDAVNKIKAWSFATGGAKEVWAEVKDGDGQADKCSDNVYANQLPTAKPVITSPLEITPIKDIYYVGDTIIAEFTIKNEGSASITFDILTVGGRLNGACPIAGCPDFTHKSLTLQLGESYHYEGSLTLHPGNYQFFIAYYIENPTPDEKKLLDENNWNTCVELGEGLTDEDRSADISVNPIDPAPSNLEVRATGELAETEWGIGVYHFLTWNYNYNFDNVKGFVIQEKFVTHPFIFLNPTEINWPYPIGFHDVATVGPSLRGHKIATPIPNINSAHTKEYRIATIFTDNLLSEWSNVATISPSTISPPSKLEATVSKDPLQIKLTWKDRSNNEMGFHIYRWEGLGIGPWFEQAGKEWPLLATVDANVETFIDTDVRSGYTFKYIIKAFNDVDISPPPNGVMVYTPALDEVPPPLTNSPPNILFANLKSPGELCIYDSQNRVTGLINGEIKEEIPDSIYDEHNEIVVVFSSTDTYRHEVAGTDGGTYGLDITSVDNGEATAFTATDIPTAVGATHEYSIDWNVLSQGEAGVTVQVDSDGDGVFEHTFTSDDELTQDDFLSGTTPVPIPVFSPIGLLALIAILIIFLALAVRRGDKNV